MAADRRRSATRVLGRARPVVRRDPAADRMFDAVANGDELIVEAQIQPRYFDRTREGLPSAVHIDACMSHAETTPGGRCPRADRAA